MSNNHTPLAVGDDDDDDRSEEDDEDETMSDETMSADDDEEETMGVESFRVAEDAEENLEDDADEVEDPINVEELALLPREALVARLITSEQRLRGTFYSTIDQVWRGESRRVERGDSHSFRILKRTKAPSFVSHGITNYYDETINNANDPALQAVPGGDGRSQASTMNRDLKREVGPFTIFAIEDDAAPVAHLVPASRSKAAVYFQRGDWRPRSGRVRALVGNDPKGNPRGRASGGRRGQSRPHRNQAQRDQHDPPPWPIRLFRPAPVRSHRSDFDAARGQELERRRLPGDGHGGPALTRRSRFRWTYRQPSIHLRGDWHVE